MNYTEKRKTMKIKFGDKVVLSITLIATVVGLIGVAKGVTSPWVLTAPLIVSALYIQRWKNLKISTEKIGLMLIVAVATTVGLIGLAKGATSEIILTAPLLLGTAILMRRSRTE